MTAAQRGTPAYSLPRAQRGRITGRHPHSLGLRPEDWRLLTELAEIHGGSRADALERVCDGYRAHVATLARGEGVSAH